MPNLAPLRPTHQTRPEPLARPELPARPAARVPAAPSRAAAPALGSDQVRLASRARGPVPRDQILFLGLNPGAAQEAAALRRQARVDVVSSENGSYAGHDLDQASGRAGFVASLGLDAGRSERLSALLAQAQANGRDELAALAQRWARAEAGASPPGRLVLSGHSDGLTIWGEGGKASLSLDEIGRLADIFPAAAAGIEDLHLSGCNTGYRSNAQYWREHFPNLRTFWGYTHTAPAGSNGAPSHLMAWEAASRGASDAIDRGVMVRSLARIARAENLAVWSRQKDYQGAQPAKGMDETEIRQIIDRYRLGEARSDNPQTGPLKQVYDVLQTMRGERADVAYDSLIGQALRLRFYDQVAQNFGLAYGEILDQAFGELGQAGADFARLDRRAALQAAARFKTAFEAQRSELAPEHLSQLEKVKTLLWHFEQLSPDFFPPEWTDPIGAEAIATAQAAFELLEPLPQWPLFPGLGLPGGLPGGLFGFPSLNFGQPQLDFGMPADFPNLNLGRPGQPANPYRLELDGMGLEHLPAGH